MLELPESTVLAAQLNEYVRGKRIQNVIAAQSQHKFAFFCGDPQEYELLLVDKVVGNAVGLGAMLKIQVEDAVLVFGDGARLRYYGANEKKPLKHQLYLEFEDQSALCVSIQMYGAIWCFLDGTYENKYYQIAMEKPSPLTDAFDRAYFEKLFAQEGQDISIKAFLATEQRIPGLGNGVLQDILYNAKIHPKRKIKTLSKDEWEGVFGSIKSTLSEMVVKGGRDTEGDLFGCPGGYLTKVSKNTVDQPCPICKEIIKKEAYMGGSVYYCPSCQKQIM